VIQSLIFGVLSMVAFTSSTHAHDGEHATEGAH
jgi:hypothetical protein